MLDATRLRVLVAVARCGSVTGAAQALNYAQPSVSHHIARLEAETGTKLMERAGRGVRLTDAGLLLVARAEEILGRLDAAEAELANHVGLGHDRIRLAAFASALSTLVSDAAVTLQAERAQSDLRLIDADPAEALRLLRAGEVEVALIFRYLCAGAEPAALADDLLGDLLGDPPGGPAGGVASGAAGGAASPGAAHSSGQIVLDEPVYLIRSADTAPTATKSAESPEPDAVLAGARDLRWIAAGEQCADLLTEICHSAGFAPNVVLQVRDYVAAQALAAAGLGATIMPSLALRAARHPGVSATELPGVRRHVLAMRYLAAPDGAATERLIGALQAAGAG